MIFSERYARALKAGALTVDLPSEVRSRTAAWMAQHNHVLLVAREPMDNWQFNSTVMEEAIRKLSIEAGVLLPELNGNDYEKAGINCILKQKAELALSFIELFWDNSLPELQEPFSRRVNEILRAYDCPWRMASGQFFKLSSDFVAAESIESSHETMIEAGFENPAEEFGKGRQFLAAGDVREAMNNAGRSYESVLKTILDVRKGNAKTLIEQLRDAGYLNDLPPDDRNSFIEKVMQCVSFMRNTFSGHGNGRDAINLPLAYGELALALAGALNSFLISLHLERQPPKKIRSEEEDTDIPL